MEEIDITSLEQLNSDLKKIIGMYNDCIKTSLNLLRIREKENRLTPYERSNIPAKIRSINALYGKHIQECENRIAENTREIHTLNAKD